MAARWGTRALGWQFASLLFLAAIVAATARGQTETGQITGTVVDQRGSAIGAVTLTARSIATGAVRTATTNASGGYAIVSLQPGVYEVTAEAAGFAVATLKAQVVVGSAVSLDFTLVAKLAGESADVVAGADGVLVDVDTAVLGTTVSQTQIRELPTLDRNADDLVALSGNVSPGDPSGRGAGVAIDGQRAASTNILLDGASNNDEFNATPGQAVPLDSVQEFTVLTNGYSAEFGRASGGIVNIATKTGSNEFHGAVYEFNRVSALASARFEDNARRPPDGEAAIKKGVFTRNQFGFSAGGPIVKDKVVFFANPEWIRIRSIATDRYRVATPELVAASTPEMQAFYRNFSLVTPFNGRIVRVGDVAPPTDSPFGKLGADFPAFGEVFTDVPADTGAGFPQNSIRMLARVDVNVSDDTTVYGRYGVEKSEYLPVNPSPYAGLEEGMLDYDNNILGSITHVFSPHLVTQSKLTYNRLNLIPEYGETLFGPTFLGNFDVPFDLPGHHDFVGGGPQNLLQFYEDANYSLGQHQLRFGGSYVRILDDRTFGLKGSYEFLYGHNDFEWLDSFVLGRVDRFVVTIDPQGHYPLETIHLPVGAPSFTRNNRYNESAIYTSDTYKAHARITLTLGLRYEYFGVQHNEDQTLDSNFYYGEGANVFERIRNGRVLPATASPVGRLYRPDWNDLGPRLGVAWDVLGDGRTSLRGGYGVAYERNFGNVTYNVAFNPPAEGLVSITPADLGMASFPVYTDTLGPLAGTGTTTFPRTEVRHIDENLRTAYAHQWSLSLQHELFGNSVASVEYAGSKGVGLYSISDINRRYSGAVYLGLPAKGQPGADPDNPEARLNRQYSEINTRGNGGFSTYNGLTLGFDSRDLKGTGLFLTSRYSWSHTIDNLSSTFSESVNNYNLGFLDPFDPRLDKGNADYDIRHRFVSSGVWVLPLAEDAEGWTERLLDGWLLTYIYTAQTGTPFTIFDCANAVAVCIRMLQVAPVNSGGHGASRPLGRNRYVYIDLTSQLAGAGTYANAAATAAAGFPISDFGPFPNNMTGRNAFRAAGSWNVNAVVAKKVALGGRSSLQVRAEFYNLFNHPNLVTKTDRAVIQLESIRASYAGRREVQLAVKIIF